MQYKEKIDFHKKMAKKYLFLILVLNAKETF